MCERASTPHAKDACDHAHGASARVHVNTRRSQPRIRSHCLNRVFVRPLRCSREQATVCRSPMLATLRSLRRAVLARALGALGWQLLHRARCTTLGPLSLNTAERIPWVAPLRLCNQRRGLAQTGTPSLRRILRSPSAFADAHHTQGSRFVSHCKCGVPNSSLWRIL